METEVSEKLQESIMENQLRLPWTETLPAPDVKPEAYFSSF